MSAWTSLESTVVPSTRRPTPFPAVSCHCHLYLSTDLGVYYLLVRRCTSLSMWRKRANSSDWQENGHLAKWIYSTAAQLQQQRLQAGTVGDLVLKVMRECGGGGRGEQSQGQCRASWLTLYSSSAASVANPWSHLTAVHLNRVKCRLMKASGTAHARALKRNVRLSLVRLTEAYVPSFSCRRNGTAADVCA